MCQLAINKSRFSKFCINWRRIVQNLCKKITAIFLWWHILLSSKKRKGRRRNIWHRQQTVTCFSVFLLARLFVASSFTINGLFRSFFFLSLSQHVRGKNIGSRKKEECGWSSYIVQWHADNSRRDIIIKIMIINMFWEIINFTHRAFLWCFISNKNSYHHSSYTYTPTVVTYQSRQIHCCCCWVFPPLLSSYKCKQSQFGDNKIHCVWLYMFMNIFCGKIMNKGVDHNWHSSSLLSINFL